MTRSGWRRSGSPIARVGASRMPRFPSVTEMMDALGYTPEARRLRTTSQVLDDYNATFPPQEVPVKKTPKSAAPGSRASATTRTAAGAVVVASTGKPRAVRRLDLDRARVFDATLTPAERLSALGYWLDHLSDQEGKGSPEVARFRDFKRELATALRAGETLDPARCSPEEQESIRAELARMKADPTYGTILNPGGDAGSAAPPESDTAPPAPARSQTAHPAPKPVGKKGRGRKAAISVEAESAAAEAPEVVAV